MNKYAQILNGKAHWIFENESVPQFAPNIVIVKITPAMGEVQEGWDYVEVSQTFTPPEPQPEPVETLSTLEEMQIEQLYQTALLEMTLL